MTTPNTSDYIVRDSIYLQAYKSNSTCTNRVYFKMFVGNNQRRLRHVNRPPRGRWEKRSKLILYRSAAVETSDVSHSFRNRGNRMWYHVTLENVENLCCGYGGGKCRGKISFWCAFAKLRNAITSFVMSVCVCPSIRLGQLCYHWKDFH
jgi:hypothetical protein